MKIILISGHAQNGKDTTANYIKEKLCESGKRVIIAHNADLLKYICRTFFDWDGVKDEAGRQMLQYVGTDIIRRQRPAYLADFVIDIADMFTADWDYMIVPDTRFPNEIWEWDLRGYDIVHLRVVRENFETPLTDEQQRHESETALDDVTPDALLLNDGDLERLYARVDDFINNCL